MSAVALFVEPDGHLITRAMEDLPSTWTVPVIPDVKVAWDGDSAALVSFDTVRYQRAGQTHDGTPVYCAEGWQCREHDIATNVSRYVVTQSYSPAECLDGIVDMMKLGLRKEGGVEIELVVDDPVPAPSDDHLQLHASRLSAVPAA